MIPKALGGFRPIIYLSVFNKYIVTTKFKMETIRTVMFAIRQDNWMVSGSEGRLPSSAHPSRQPASSSLFLGGMPSTVLSPLLQPLYRSTGLSSNNASHLCRIPSPRLPYSQIPGRLVSPNFVSRGFTKSHSLSHRPLFSFGDSHKLGEFLPDTRKRQDLPRDDNLILSFEGFPKAEEDTKPPVYHPSSVVSLCQQWTGCGFSGTCPPSFI